MKTLVRYVCLLTSVITVIAILCCHQIFFKSKSVGSTQNRVSAGSYQPLRIQPVKLSEAHVNCSTARCMSHRACKHGPTLSIRNISRSTKIHSPQFKKVLQSFQILPNYVPNPEFESCFTLFNVDMLDRDVLNPASPIVVPDLDLIRNYMKSHPATNYIFINLFSGTYPDYLEQVDFDVGPGVLMKSSATQNNLRTNFDISFPLLNILKVDALTSTVHSIHVPSSTTQHSSDHFLATFKGKRYTHGIGSETRDLLPSLSNSRDIISLVTCEHNKDEWKKQLGILELQQCESSIREYHRPEHNYEMLLQNSTFCFVPRGRRLDSFRLREVMRSGCIPVILSNGFALPFAEVLDWSKMAIVIDELRVTWISSILRNIPVEVVNSMKVQASFVYRTYFSSLDHILRTSLKILYDRINPEPLPKWVWNTYPGALFVDFDFSTNPWDFPFWLHEPSTALNVGLKTKDMVTVVIVRGQADTLEMCKNVYLMMPRNLKVVFVSLGLDRRGNILLDDGLVIKENTVLSLLYLDTVFEISGSFILRVDCSSYSSNLGKQARDVLSMTHHFPDRIIGYGILTHVKQASSNNADVYSISSDTTSNYSVVDLNLSLHHKYYYFLMRKFFNDTVVSHLQKSPECFSIYFNMFVSYVTLNPPIALRSEISVDEEDENEINGDSRRNTDNLKQQQQSICLMWFQSVLGHVPLKHSNLIYTIKN